MGFLLVKCEEEAKENSLSDVEELLNANWIHSFTFQFQATALRDAKKVRREYEENTQKMQRKIRPVALENDSMTTFNNVRVEEDKLNFELSYIYAMNKNHAAPKNA